MSALPLLAVMVAIVVILVPVVFAWQWERQLPGLKKQAERELPWACGECSYARWLLREHGIEIYVQPHRCREAQLAAKAEA